MYRYSNGNKIIVFPCGAVTEGAANPGAFYGYLSVEAEVVVKVGPQDDTFPRGGESLKGNW